MPDKLEEIRKKIEQIQAKSAVASEMKAFITLVVAFVKKNKEELANLSAENLQTIKDSIAYIEENYTKWDKSLDTKINTATGKFERDIAILKGLIEKVKTIKPVDGVDGKDADETKIVEDVLAKIKLPEYEVFTLDEKGEEIVKEINALPIDDEDLKIDASHIKNLPKSLGNGSSHAIVRSIALNDLTDVIADNPSTGQALVWNGANWVNDNVSGSGGGSTWFFDQTPTDGGAYTLLQGDIDAVNTLFTVSEGQYITGKLIVILNGQVLSQGIGANEYTETNPVIGTFTLNTAPSGADELQAFYTTTAGGGGGNAAGADTQVQFNDAGALNGDPTFLFNKTTNELTVATVLVDDEAYAAGWNGDLSVPTKNAIYDKIETLGGGGNVTKVGTPVDNQIGVWTGDGTIEGDASLTWDGTSLNIATAKNLQIAGATVLADAAGTTTLSNIDAIDATTEATIEAAIDTLANLTSIQGQTVTLSAPLTLPADPNADRLFFWDDSAGATAYLTTGNGLTITTTTIAVDSASDTVDGIVELAIASETTTGTDATRAVTPDGLAGSDYGKRVVNILVSDPTGSAITTGDGKACFRVPSVMNGWNLVGVAGSLSTVSSSGLPTFQVRRSRRSTATTRSDVDMLTTKLSIDASEFDSVDATTAVVIDTANDDVNTGDMIYIDIDVAGTGAKGLVAELIFQLP